VCKLKHSPSPQKKRERKSNTTTDSMGSTSQVQVIIPHLAGCHTHDILMGSLQGI